LLFLILFKNPTPGTVLLFQDDLPDFATGYFINLIAAVVVAKAIHLSEL
jgi:hypothetical protein